jgi:hypothetical protein
MPSLPLWYPQSWRFRLLAGVVLALFAVYAATYLTLTARRFAADPIGDFFGLWTAGRLAANHAAAQVYDPAQLHAAQVALGMPNQTEYPFPYPPSFLLLMAPLGFLPRGVAFAVVMGGSLLLFLWATVKPGWRLPQMLAVLLAPTTTLALVAGQTGFLEGALLAGGFRLAGRRPICAGILFGLLTYKPQIGILIPVALVSAKLWRTIGAAIVTIALLVAVTSAIFGAATWLAWADNIVAYAHQFAAESSEIAHLMPTVAQGLERLGAAPAIADLGQGAAALAAVAVVWRCFRSGPGELACACLFAATFLATPHAFVYDMPVLATAILLVIDERRRAGGAFTSPEMLVLFIVAVAPISLPGGQHFPVVALSLCLFIALVLHRHWQVGGRGTASPVSVA